MTIGQRRYHHRTTGVNQTLGREADVVDGNVRLDELTLRGVQRGRENDLKEGRVWGGVSVEGGVVVDPVVVPAGDLLQLVPLAGGDVLEDDQQRGVAGVLEDVVANLTAAGRCSEGRTVDFRRGGGDVVGGGGHLRLRVKVRTELLGGVVVSGPVPERVELGGADHLPVSVDACDGEEECVCMFK